VAAPVSTPGLAVPGLAVPGGYSAAAAAPVNAFEIAFITGDNTSATQAFAPAGWTTLPAVTASNGTDHSCDVVLTAAWTVTSSSESVTGTAGTAEDLSGSILGVQAGAPSPIPEDSAVAPGGAGRTILEAAIGSGFQTPADEMEWVTLNDSALTPAEEDKCFWAWEETSTGIPYALGQLQSSEGSVTLDNGPGNFTPSNAAGLYYPGVTTGTPLRLRIMLGTVGGVPVDRTYIWQRNALGWTEKRDEDQHSYVETGLTDGWSVAGVPCPTPYRGEVLGTAPGDAPHSWWAMDDQPLAGGVQPASLASSAPGNTNTMSIVASPGGITAGDSYTTTGIDATATGGGSTIVPPSVAVSAVGQQQGWNYGDPQSSPASYSTGNPVTSSPGSAAWQQTGLLGSGGANTWFLAALDPAYPPLSGGITVKGWFSADFFASATGWKDNGTGQYYPIAGQPCSVITLATLSTGSAPVAILQLSLAGALELITYNGPTATTHPIYSSSDLRSASWHCIDLQLTTTTWTVLVNGGLTANVSGTAAGMTAGWTWLTLNGDYGANGGSSPADIQHGGNVAYSHWAVWGSILPPWRLLSQYSAAITGSGLLPAPQTVAVAAVINELPTGYTPDGTLYQGSYGYAGGTSLVPFTFSGEVAAAAGSYTSGPSARAVTAGIGVSGSHSYYGNAIWLSYTGLAPQYALYTAAAANAETSAATVCGSGDSFSSGFGAAAADAGVCSTGGGTGASPPSAPTPLGDTVAQRLERLLGLGGMTAPARAIDATAAELVQAALDAGGQQCGANCQNIVSSDYGMWFVDNCNTQSYRSRAHLSSDTVIWYLSSAGPAYGYPYQPGMDFGNDPQYVTNVIQVAPYSPDGASLPFITPSDATAANASQRQYGPRPLATGTTSYLQSAARIQAAADWILATYGSLERRVLTLKVDAAGYPAAWPYVAGANVSDLVQVTDQPMSGGPLSVEIYRISNMSGRKMAFGANGSRPEASLTITADPLPPGGYFT
jgi:hypothetical protein